MVPHDCSGARAIAVATNPCPTPVFARGPKALPGLTMIAGRPGQLVKHQAVFLYLQLRDAVTEIGSVGMLFILIGSERAAP